MTEDDPGFEMLSRGFMGLLNEAASQDHLEAIYTCARIKFGNRQEVEAFDLFRRAAEGGHPRAQLNYGLMLIMGIGCVKDEKSGLALVSAAANHDCPAAQLQLGMLFEYGNVCPVDLRAACLLYSKVSDIPMAEVFYAKLTHKRPGGHFEKKGKFWKVFSRGGRAGGDKLDVDATAVLMKVVKLHRDMIAIRMYARCLAYGIGTEVSRPDAVRYMRIAAVNGDAWAQYKYAMFLRHDETREANEREVCFYFALAAGKSHAKAVALVNQCPDKYYQGL